MTQRIEFHAMGCRMLAILDGDDSSPVLERVPAQFEVWEQALSRFRSDSELCELNRKAGHAVEVSETVWDVFEAAREAHSLTGGLVNPLVSEALAYAGYERSFDLMQAREFSMELAPAVPTVPALRDVVADAPSRTIGLPGSSRLDFGGIAKGWAAHQMVLSLGAHGPALFSAGGDIAVSGPRSDGEPWDISVEDPFQRGAYLEMLYIERGGVATSGKDYRNWMRSGVAQHHIINPHTGLPAETDILTATVIASTAMRAEAIAKAVLISGSQAGLAWLDSDEELAGLLVLDNGQRLYSRNLDRYL